LENILCQINTYSTKVIHGGLLLSIHWLITLPVWHLDAD